MRAYSVDGCENLAGNVVEARGGGFTLCFVHSSVNFLEGKYWSTSSARMFRISIGGWSEKNTSVIFTTVSVSILLVAGGPRSLRVTILYGLPHGSLTIVTNSSFQHAALLRVIDNFRRFLAPLYMVVAMATASSSWVVPIVKCGVIPYIRRRCRFALFLVLVRLALTQSLRKAAISAFHQ